jgi:hypothetical protein
MNVKDKLLCDFQRVCKLEQKDTALYNQIYF